MSSGRIIFPISFHLYVLLLHTVPRNVPKESLLAALSGGEVDFHDTSKRFFCWRFTVGVYWNISGFVFMHCAGYCRTINLKCMVCNGPRLSLLTWDA